MSPNARNLVRVVLAVVLVAAVRAQDEQPPAFALEILPEQSVVAPGTTTVLGLKLVVEEGWHTYHPVLDTGLPTTFTFDLPPGVRAGAVRFPTPQLGQMGPVEYLGLPNPAICVVPLTIDPTVRAGTKLAIGVQIEALVCKVACLPVSDQARVELAVAPSAEAGPAAEAVAQARAALPPLIENAPFISGSSIGVEPSTVKIGEPARIVATIRVAPEMHILHPKQTVDGLVPARFFVQDVSGIAVKYDEASWPKPKRKEIPYVGAVNELSGEVQVSIPLEIIDSKFPSGPVRTQVLFQYQACSEDGSCHAPEMATGWLEFAADTPNPPRAPSAAATSLPLDGGAGASSALGGTSAADAPGRGGGDTPLWLALLLAVAGGLILNVMPCVLPVISIKVLSFVQQAGDDPTRVWKLGLAFCAGIMVWFWLFALLSLSGNLPLQYPPVVIALASVLFVMALNLFGVFELTLPGSAVGAMDQLTTREGYSGAFFKGFLATLLGTACTGPFLVGAMAYALTQPFWAALIVFTGAGIGMSAPYLLLSANPAWLKLVPRPGNWMITFKQATGFVLLGTNIWLLWVLGGQIGAERLVWVLAFWSFLGLAVWMLGKVNFSWSLAQQWRMYGASAAVIALGAWLSFGVLWVHAGGTRQPMLTDGAAVRPEVVDATIAAVAEADWKQGIPWQPYQPGLATALAERGYTVYVDYTARWCATCITNKAAVLETDLIRGLMSELRVVPLEADFTNKDPVLTKDLQAHGRNTVPLNLIYPAGKPDGEYVLPPLLTQSEVQARLRAAGPSQPSNALARAAEPGDV